MKGFKLTNHARKRLRVNLFILSYITCSNFFKFCQTGVQQYESEIQRRNSAIDELTASLEQQKRANTKLTTGYEQLANNQQVRAGGLQS